MKGLGRGNVEEKDLWDLEKRLKELIELQRNDFRAELEERLKQLRDTILDELNRALARYQKNSVTVAPTLEGPNPKDLEARIEMVAERLEMVLEDLKNKVYDLEGKSGQVHIDIDRIHQDITNLEFNFNNAIEENLKSEQDSVRIQLQEFVINLIDENRRKKVNEVAILRERLESYTSRPSTPTVMQPIVPKFEFNENRVTETVLNLFTADNDQLRKTILAIVRKDFETHKRDLKADVSEGLYELDKKVNIQIKENRNIDKELEARLRKVADLEARLGGIEARVSEGRRLQDNFGALVSTTQGDLDAIRRMVGTLGDDFMARIKAYVESEAQGLSE